MHCLWIQLTIFLRKCEGKNVIFDRIDEKQQNSAKQIVVGELTDCFQIQDKCTELLLRSMIYRVSYLYKIDQ